MTTTPDPLAIYNQLNTAENTLGRALTRLKKGDLAKAKTETETGIAQAQVALAMLCDCEPHDHEEPAPPPPPPPPAPTVPALPKEPSGFFPAHNFTEAEWLTVTRAAGIPGLVTQVAGDFGEDVSSWRLKLGPSGILTHDDPVLFYGQPGAAHLHHGYSVAFDAFTTHESLMHGSCNLAVQGGPLYHSAIFAPAMIHTLEQHVINLHGGDLYYKVHPPGHPSLYGDPVENVPKGLMFVARGGTFTLGEYYDSDRNVRFHTKAHPTLEAMIAEWDAMHGGYAPIPAGFAVRMSLANPQCWDGKNRFLTGSAHMAERIRDSSTDWKNRAPPTHPIIIPTPHPIPFFKVLVEDEVRHWRLSSDPTQAPAGSSIHWDYIEAINDRVREGMMEIFREHRTSSGGPIGLTGRSLLGAPGDDSPARLPIPPHPTMVAHHH